MFSAIFLFCDKYFIFILFIFTHVEWKKKHKKSTSLSKNTISIADLNVINETKLLHNEWQIILLVFYPNNYSFSTIIILNRLVHKFLSIHEKVIYQAQVSKWMNENYANAREDTYTFVSSSVWFSIFYKSLVYLIKVEKCVGFDSSSHTQ